MRSSIAAVVMTGLFVASCAPTRRHEYAAVYGGGTKELILATGSPGELGLVKVIAGEFSRANKVRVLWRKAGSGKSLEFLRNKQVDAVMVHAPSAEKKAVSEGWARCRMACE